MKAPIWGRVLADGKPKVLRHPKCMPRLLVPVPSSGIPKLGFRVILFFRDTPNLSFGFLYYWSRNEYSGSDFSGTHIYGTHYAETCTQMDTFGIESGQLGMFSLESTCRNFWYWTKFQYGYYNQDILNFWIPRVTRYGLLQGSIWTNTSHVAQVLTSQTDPWGRHLAFSNGILHASMALKYERQHKSTLRLRQKRIRDLGGKIVSSESPERSHTTVVVGMVLPAPGPNKERLGPQP
ncbi:uncharacterized protein EV420DRAFT_1486588 [Desarmillaria tabescens]|uniref:Uncharacterized protein n=1 Tax=Armillaria tabescens TaxID=1929756 RepID=A0AA39JB28_ARMTA|nr:uncharacterized protein EV420DRAFT_1486588 [Desarmillaria tabescens]KAK0438705.1 hypothetical protein EV420DRAFT_1486588 [Desarmillaria tabescens]